MPLAAIPAAAWVAGGATIAGSAIAASGARSAAKTAAGAQDRAAAEQARQFDITQQQTAPFREAGVRGLEQYEEMLGGYGAAEGMIPSDVRDPFKFGAEEFEQYQDPGYQFRLSESTRALERGAAKTGQLRAGSRYRGLMDLGQQMASQEFGAARGRAFQDYQTDVAGEQERYQRGLSQYGRQYADPMSRYGQLAGIGQQTTIGLANLRAGMAQQVGQNITQAGAYGAAGQMGAARAWQGGLSDLGRLYGQQGQAPSIQQYTGTGGGGSMLNPDGDSPYSQSSWSNLWP